MSKGLWGKMKKLCRSSADTAPCTLPGRCRSMSKQDCDLCMSHQSDSLKGHVGGVRARQRVTFNWAADSQTGMTPGFARTHLLQPITCTHTYQHIHRPLLTGHFCTCFLIPGFTSNGGMYPLFPFFVLLFFRIFPYIPSYLSLWHNCVCRRGKKPKPCQRTSLFVQRDVKPISSKNTWTWKFHAWTRWTRHQNSCALRVLIRLLL